jgi:hypothetical protein
MRLKITINPPNNIIGVGLSGVPIQTHNGPRTVSNSSARLTLEACVYRAANDTRKNEVGRITIPVKII